MSGRPFTHLLEPEENFGALLDPAIGLAVAIIVLQEGLSLNFGELRTSGQGIGRIVGLGVPLIASLGAVALADLNRRAAAGWRFRTEPVQGEALHDALRPASGLRLPVAIVEANGALIFASPETKLPIGGKGTLVVFEAPNQRPDGAGEGRGDR